MAEPFVSDDEQLDNLVKWLQDNGRSLLAGVVLGLVVIFVWQWWHGRQAQQAQQASTHYDALIQAVATNDAERVQREWQTLRADFADSTYARLAGLQLARRAVAAGDLPAAEHHLQGVLASVRQDALDTIARLRLARLQLALNRYDEAEQQLAALKGSALTAEVEELRGDLYLARNDPQQARIAYQAAQAAGSTSPLLQIKLDNLPPPPPAGS